MVNKKLLFIFLLQSIAAPLICIVPMTDIPANFSDKKEYFEFLRKNYLPKESFIDVYMQNNVIKEAKKVVDTLKYFGRYAGLGALIPNMITIQGTRGCGKKLLAKAIAGESRSFLFFIDSAPTADVCMELLEERPIIILDEKESSVDNPAVDSNLYQVTQQDKEDNDKKDDGAKKRDAIFDLIKRHNKIGDKNPIILMKTEGFLKSNGPSLLFYDEDEAGKFGNFEGMREKVIYIPLPDKDLRKGMMLKFLRNITLCENEKVEDIAQVIADKTNNFGPLQLKELINEAALMAGRDFSMNNKECYGVEKKHFEEAFYEMSKKVQSGTGGGSFFVESFYYTYAEETRFKDVKGLEGVLTEVKEFIDIMNSAKNYEEIGVKRPKGLLLEGLPGTGKTMIARAIAGEAGCCFISAVGSQFVNGWVGGGPGSIRALFNFAKQMAQDRPVLLFIDEFDSLGKRSEGSDSVSNEYRNTINELLKQMDGFSKDDKIFVVAATNRAEGLDPSILRNGRFDRRVYVPLPSHDGRTEILLSYMETVVCDKNMDKKIFAKELAKKCKGFSGASLKGLVNEAAILAIRASSKEVKAEHFLDAYKKVAVYAQHGVGGEDEGFSYTFSEEMRFSDVVGIEEVMSEVEGFLDSLKHPEKYHSMGSKHPKGMVLYGDPGTGKTLIARAIAGEAGCCFISVNASQFVKMYVGSGPLAVRRLFDFARKMARNKKVIIFIDELDAFGKRSGGDGGSKEYNNTINELLTKLDGFAQDEDIAVIGATNNINLLDDALLREGRFDLKIKVPLPKLESRAAILKYYLKKRKLSPEVSLENLCNRWAKETRGLSGATLESMVNRAALLAVREGAEFLKEKHLEEAFLKVVMGLENKIKQNKEDLEKTAAHEAGHALVAVLLGREVTRVSILSRGQALGVTFPIEKHEIFSYNFKSDILGEVMIFLGGLAAEVLKYGEGTPGVSNDLLVANKLVSDMVNLYGMSIGELHGVTSQNVSSETVKMKFDMEVVSLMKKCMNDTMTLLRNNKEKLDELTKALLEKETLMGDEIYKITGKQHHC